MCGFAADIAVAAAIVMSYVRCRYRSSVMPIDDTPRQKKQASHVANLDWSGLKSRKSSTRISRIFGAVRPTGRRPITRTERTLGSSRHSIRTPDPTIPVAPKITTFMSAGRHPGACRIVITGHAGRRGTEAVAGRALRYIVEDARFGDGRP